MVQTVIDVAVGLIIQQGQALIAWRDAARHQGGRYEFAGGKVDVGETPKQALVRELHEELAITATQIERLQVLRYRYPEKTVCLHVFLVTDFLGEPVGKEGQPLKWVPLYELFDYQFPDANQPIVRAAQLPRHYIVSTDSADLASWLQTQAPLPQAAWLYVRLPNHDAAQQMSWIRAMADQRPDVQLLVSATLYGQDLPANVRGFHLKHTELMAQTTLIRDHPQQFWLASCHDLASLAHAADLGVDAVLLGAVCATQSHRERVPLGWSEFAQLTRQANVPVYALGGISPQDLPQAMRCGAYGVAGIRAFYGASAEA